MSTPCHRVHIRLATSRTHYISFSSKQKHTESSIYMELKVKVERVEDKEMSEPVSPTGQYFNSSVLSISVISILEFDNPIDDSSSLALINDVFLPINPRFSSIMVTLPFLLLSFLLSLSLSRHLFVSLCWMSMMIIMVIHIYGSCLWFIDVNEKWLESLGFTFFSCIYIYILSSSALVAWRYC